MVARRQVVLTLLGAALALAACSDDIGGPEQASPSVAPTTSSAMTSSAVTSEAPTREEEAAEAATQAFERLLQISDAASREPNARDWEPEIRRYAADPAALLTVQSVRDYATLGLRQEGDSVVDLRVTSVDLASPEGPTVRIAGCYDSQSTQTVNVETGEVVPPGTPPHYMWDITVTRYEAEPSEPWLVSTLEPRPDQPC
ncbi:hypothetical protein [Geodermatophilus sp. DSM 44513]|uniref:hypothetical protein n=1 Tax=Geodermatophilus sp. DSM 44513 TaxID=1528104 RepID=UPI0028F6CBB4|nr:hypothetical protein [Geodermatophilus sp. DSM 44513]WNV77900.1 hypothetical protein RTG05_20315 [Geodermatophilus sp. DSM 44513]